MDDHKMTHEPRVFTTDDGRHAASLYQMQPPLEPGDFVFNIDQLAGSGFDTLFYGASLEGGVVMYDSQVAPIWGDNVTQWTHPVWYRASRNIKQLISDGHDPLKLLVDRAHEKGIWFFCSNWVNFQGSRREQSAGLGRTTDWVYEHPQFEVGVEDDPRAAELDDKRFNFLHEEVRHKRFVIYEEYLSRYETDGVDLDLCSFSPFCRFDESDKLAPLMTAWIADLRGVADKAEQAQGRRKRIYARIPSHRQAWRALGYDVETWVEQKLVDGLIVLAGGPEAGVDHSHDVSEAVKLTRGSDCRVLSGMSVLLTGQLEQYAMSQTMYAGASNAYAQGADGFGFCDAHWGPQGWPWGEAEYGVARLLGQADLLATADKHYHARATGRTKTDWTPGVAQRLPRQLVEGETIPVELYISDDLAHWDQQGRIESVRLSVRVSSIEASLNELRVELNGQQLGDDLLDLNDLGYRLYSKGAIGPYGYIYEFDLPATYHPKQGLNKIEVTLDKRDKHIRSPFELYAVDCEIKYRLHRNFRREPLAY